MDDSDEDIDGYIDDEEMEEILSRQKKRMVTMVTIQ